MEDLIFYGQWTNLHDRSQNGPRLVANDYLVWSLTSITHVFTNNIVMWEKLPNNADWDCFKTPILQEILRIQNLRNHFFGRRIEVGWYTRTWFYGIWSSQFFTEARIRVIKHGRLVYEPTWDSFNTSHTSKTKAISESDQWFGQCWFCSLKRPIFASRSFVVCVWRQRSSDQDDLKGKKSRQWDTFPEPTELLLIGCLIESIWTPKSKSNTLTPKTNSQTYCPRQTSHVMNGLIFCVWFNISHFSSTNCLEVMSRKNARRCRWRKSHSKIEADDEFGLARQRKESYCACINCIGKPGENQISKSESTSELVEWAANKTQGDLWWTLAYQTTQNGMLTKHGLLKWKYDEVLEARTVRPVNV